MVHDLAVKIQGMTFNLPEKIARFIIGVEREHTLPTYIRAKIYNPKSTI